MGYLDIARRTQQQHKNNIHTNTTANTTITTSTYTPLPSSITGVCDISDISAKSLVPTPVRIGDCDKSDISDKSPPSPPLHVRDCDKSDISAKRSPLEPSLPNPTPSGCDQSDQSMVGIFVPSARPYPQRKCYDKSPAVQPTPAPHATGETSSWTRSWHVCSAIGSAGRSPMAGPWTGATRPPWSFASGCKQTPKPPLMPRT